jgi:allophanate hydrolase
MPLSYSLDLHCLRDAYASGRLTPSVVIGAVLRDIAASGDANPVWLHVASRENLLERARQLEDSTALRSLPLYGVPFAVKDNIDVAGMPTTAACPAFTYTPSHGAEVVQRLEAAGAIVIGKTNLDQFATGLVGTRSPYGACRNPFDARYISGGSSSGSAVAVASGLVSFALGTDTAGSGRVPAGCCNLVGLKPTRGVISTTGVVPACRSLDCVSIFALTVSDARAVFDAAQGFDDNDPYSRHATAFAGCTPARVRCGLPRASQLEFFGDALARAAFQAAIVDLRKTGAEIVEIDYTPYAAVAALLYEGPWVAERLAAIKSFFDRSACAMHPITRSVIEAATRYSAVDAFEAQYRLQALSKACEREPGVWRALGQKVVRRAGRERHDDPHDLWHLNRLREADGGQRPYRRALWWRSSSSQLQLRESVPLHGLRAAYLSNTARSTA